MASELNDWVVDFPDKVTDVDVDYFVESIEEVVA
jgi:hypothetical protein